MGNFGRCLTYTLLATLAALPIWCITTGFVLGLVLMPPHGAMAVLSSLSLGFVVAIAAWLLGLVPALVYGAPAYALLAYYKRNNLATAALVGVVPGLPLWGLSPEWAGLSVIFGIPVACLTHLLASARIGELSGHGSNNSFKPKPLRGSA